MEQVFGNYIARHPLAASVQAQVACSTTQCEVQLLDTRLPVQPATRSPSSEVGMGLAQASEVLQSVMMSGQLSAVYGNKPYNLLFFERYSP